MICFKFTMKNKEGMHMKLAGKIVEKAITLESDIQMRKGRKTGNAKLIFHVLGLMIKDGEEVELSLSGPKEEEEAEILQKFIEEVIK